MVNNRLLVLSVAALTTSAHGVPRQEVDVATSAHVRAKQLGERFGVLGGVILTREKGVLKRHSPPRGLFVELAILEQRLQRVRLRGRNEFLT